MQFYSSFTIAKLPSEPWAKERTQLYNTQATINLTFNLIAVMNWKKIAFPNRRVLYRVSFVEILGDCDAPCWSRSCNRVTLPFLPRFLGRANGAWGRVGSIASCLLRVTCVRLWAAQESHCHWILWNLLLYTNEFLWLKRDVLEIGEKATCTPAGPHSPQVVNNILLQSISLLEVLTLV